MKALRSQEAVPDRFAGDVGGRRFGRILLSSDGYKYIVICNGIPQNISHEKYLSSTLKLSLDLSD